MTWTYDPGSIAKKPKDQVRRLIGDVIQNDQQIADEEINFALTQRSSVYGAAAECCRYISSQFSRKVDVVAQAAGGGALKTNYSAQAKAYLQMAIQFDGRAAMTGGGLPYAGGTSVTDKQAMEQDTDRVAPQFNIGMEDNYLPVGPIGNEVNSDASSATDLGE